MQPGSFFAGLATPVDGNQEVMAAAFHIKCNFPVVTNDDGTDVETMRSHRSNGNRLTVRNDDRTSYAERIGGAWEHGKDLGRNWGRGNDCMK